MIKRKTEQIVALKLSDWVPVHPPSEQRRIKAVTEIIESRLRVARLGGESVREGGGKGAGGRVRVTEGVVGVGRDDGAGCTGVGADVAVVVVGRVEGVAPGADGEETADAAGALERAREVLATGLENPRCAARGAAQGDLAAAKPATGDPSMALHGAASEFGGDDCRSSLWPSPGFPVLAGSTTISRRPIMRFGMRSERICSSKINTGTLLE